MLSALAALVLKIAWLKQGIPDVYANRADVAAALASLATIIAAISATGNFGRKWQTNRISRGRIERLQIALSDPAADAAVIRKELQDTVKSHDEDIVGTPIR